MKNQILFWLGSTSLFLVTRIFNLLNIPIFTDEAIYTYWAQVALHDPANRFISLVDGKQPLFIWIAAIFQKFINDPLLASRLVSAFAGFGSFVGIYLVAKTLFSDKVGKITALLYIILPFTLLYDRLAIFDSLLTMLGIYSVFFTIQLAKEPRLDLAILTGTSIGLATLTKSSGVFFLYLLPFSALLFNFSDKKFRITLAKWIVMAGIVFFISQIIYNTLRLSPLFYIIDQKNLSFIRSFPEVIKDPFLFFSPNFKSIFHWSNDYLGLPLVLIFLSAFIFGIVKKNYRILYLSTLILAPFLAECLFNKVLYPRFMLFYFPYVIILIAFAVKQILDFAKDKKRYVFVLLLLFIASPTLTSFKLLTSPQEAKIADADAGQYLNGWPSGYGVKEVVNFLKQESKDQQVLVGTEGTFGLLPYAIQIYFFADKNIQLSGFWPVNENNLPAQVLDSAKTKKTYFVFNENQKEIENPRLKLIAKYQKGIGNSFMRLYEVVP